MATSLLYNSISLPLLGTDTILEEPVYEGPNYLHTKVTLQVNGVFSPSDIYPGYAQQDVIRSIAQGLEVAPITVQPPAVTLREIRHALSEPRKKFVYSVDGVPIFAFDPAITDDGAQDEFGDIFFSHDANFGPYPVRFQVNKICGNRLVYFNYTIEFFLRECSKYQENPSPIKSHLYSVSEATNQDGYRFREIRGKLLFDSGQLVTDAGVADNYTDFKIHPVPLGFRQITSERTVSPDGLMMEYVYIFQETRQQYINPQIRRIESTYKRVTSDPGLLMLYSGVITESFGAGANVASSALQGAQAGAVGGPVGMAAGAAAGTALGLVKATTGLLSTLNNLLPLNVYTVYVKVYGTPGINAATLVHAAYDVAMTRIFGNALDINRNAYNLILQVRGSQEMLDVNSEEGTATLIQTVPGFPLLDVLLRPGGNNSSWWTAPSDLVVNAVRDQVQRLAPRSPASIEVSGFNAVNKITSLISYEISPSLPETDPAEPYQRFEVVLNTSEITEGACGAEVSTAPLPLPLPAPVYERRGN